MSKGSWKRPVFVSQETYSRNFDRIFGKPEDEEDKPELEDETGPTKKALQERMEKDKG